MPGFGVSDEIQDLRQRIRTLEAENDSLEEENIEAESALLQAGVAVCDEHGKAMTLAEGVRELAEERDDLQFRFREECKLGGQYEDMLNGLLERAGFGNYECAYDGLEALLKSLTWTTEVPTEEDDYWAYDVYPQEAFKCSVVREDGDLFAVPLDADDVRIPVEDIRHWCRIPKPLEPDASTKRTHDIHAENERPAEELAKLLDSLTWTTEVPTEPGPVVFQRPGSKRWVPGQIAEYPDGGGLFLDPIDDGSLWNLDNKELADYRWCRIPEPLEPEGESNG